MSSRRQFIGATLAAAGSSLPITGCTYGTRDAYEAAVASTWRHGDSPPKTQDALHRELVRYATLAASSHNTQCWRFRLGNDTITIGPDLGRRCPAVDPDNHHLFVSLGCATENLVQAALANGLQAEVRVEDAMPGEIVIALASTRPSSSPLYAAIPDRQSTRTTFDSKPLTAAELRLLSQAGSSTTTSLALLTAAQAKETVLEYVVAGNTAQLNDPAFIAELKTWLRFGRGEALDSRDGLFSATTGNPVLPRWLASPLFNLLLTVGSENDKYAQQVRSSAGIAVFISESDDRRHWVEVGRACQRFALQATALGIRTAFINQPVEVAALRPQFATWLGAGAQRPDLVMRFGRGPRMPQSLRRPVEAVIDS